MRDNPVDWCFDTKEDARLARLVEGKLGASPPGEGCSRCHEPLDPQAWRFEGPDDPAEPSWFHLGCFAKTLQADVKLARDRGSVLLLFPDGDVAERIADALTGLARLGLAPDIRRQVRDT